MTKQITNCIMMVRPAAFHRNEETAVNNFYQQAQDADSYADTQALAIQEFDTFVENLRSNGVKVIVVQDVKENDTPDSIFPNNWNSFHEDGTMFLFPMYAENRRREVREEILEMLYDQFIISEKHDLRNWETKNCFLEGTGSMILDRPNKIAYASISDRTNADVMHEFCELSGFAPVLFTAYQTANDQRLPIYHTNVMMCLGESFAVVCLESIDDEAERALIIEKLETTGKEIVAITENQCDHFAGNMLQVCNDAGDRFVVMSQSAYDSLDENQREQLSRHGKLLPQSLHTIEKFGGGSARCMMAEIFLQPKERL